MNRRFVSSVLCTLVLAAWALCVAPAPPAAAEGRLRGLSIGDVVLNEAGYGLQTAAFPVRLNVVKTKTVTVDYATAPGTATSPADFLPTSGRLTFLPGEVTKFVHVQVVGDPGGDEPNENYTVQLSNPVNATIDKGVGIGAIREPWQPPGLSVSDVDVVEGDAGERAVQLTIRLARSSTRPFDGLFETLSYGGSATEGRDFGAVNESFMLAAGEVVKQVTVPILPDLEPEGDEFFSVVVWDFTDPTRFYDVSATVTIHDDDDHLKLPVVGELVHPSVAISSATVEEGHRGDQPLGLLVSLSRPSLLPVSVDYEAVDGTAIAGDDYAAAAGRVEFAPGEVSKLVEVTIHGDVEEGQTLTNVAEDQRTETFSVELRNVAGAVTDPRGATATIGIVHDDPLPSVLYSRVTVPEGDNGTGLAVAWFHLSAPLTAPVTFDLVVDSASGTATHGVDYRWVPATITFGAGDSANPGPRAVEVFGDATAEPSETFSILPVRTSGPPIGASRAEFIILD